MVEWCVRGQGLKLQELSGGEEAVEWARGQTGMAI